MADFDPQDPRMTDNEDTSSTHAATDAAHSASRQEQGTSPKGSATVTQEQTLHRKRTIFYIAAVVIALLLFTAAVMTPLVDVLKNILSLLSPLIIGGVIAYLCDPILQFFEYRLFRRMKKGGARRRLSLFCTVLTALGIVALIGVMMLPQFFRSLQEFFDKDNLNQNLTYLLSWLTPIVEKLPGNIDISTPEKFVTKLGQILGTTGNSLSQFLERFQDMSGSDSLIGELWILLRNLFNTFKNLFIGVFIAFYLLASKEKRIAQVKKFRRAVFSDKVDRRITEISTLADKTFGGFIYGKILDSIVIGILTFVLMTIFGISPYNLLIATFVGVTNVIPVFGPFIGAIPSFFIVLISNPSKAFLFLVLILIIQQLDGNIIGPKILGDNTGVSSLCVIIAIAICSTLWGVAGMIIGVPLFAVVIELIKRMLEGKLEAKGEPTDTQAYYPPDALGNAEKDVYYEHASLRYRYEHSKLKPRLLRLRHKFYRLGRHGRKRANNAPLDEPPITEGTATESDMPSDSNIMAEATPRSNSSDSDDTNS